MDQQLAYVDITIRITERQAQGHSVEMTLNGETCLHDAFNPFLLRQPSRTDPAADTARLTGWLAADPTFKKQWDKAMGSASPRCIRLHIDTQGFDDRTYRTDSNPRALVLETRSGPKLIAIRVASDDANWAAFSADGLRLLAIVMGEMEIYDARSGKLLIRCDGDFQDGQYLYNRSGHISAAYSPDGLRIVTWSYETARILDAISGQILQQLVGHTRDIEKATYSPDGLRILTYSYDQSARIWDATTGQELQQPLRHTDGFVSATYSPDGLHILTASDDQTHVWDSQSGNVLLAWHCHREVVSAAYSPDGMHIVTAGADDSEVRVWNAHNGNLVLVLRCDPPYGVESASFSPNGGEIVTASSSGIVRVLPATFEHILAFIGSLIQRDPPLLTPDERQQFGLE